MTYSMFTMLSAVAFNSTRIRFGSHWFGLVRFGLVQSPWSRNTLKLLNIDYLSILSLFLLLLRSGLVSFVSAWVGKFGMEKRKMGSKCKLPVKMQFLIFSQLPQRSLTFNFRDQGKEHLEIPLSS